MTIKLPPPLATNGRNNGIDVLNSLAMLGLPGNMESPLPKSLSGEFVFLKLPSSTPKLSRYELLTISPNGMNSVAEISYGQLNAGSPDIGMSISLKLALPSEDASFNNPACPTTPSRGSLEETMPSESGTLSPELKKTPWFPKEVKPVRPGVYEVDYPMYSPWFRYFDGKRWRFGCCSPSNATESCIPVKLALLPWRGLASDPSQP